MLPLGCSFSCAILITVLLPSDCVSRLHNPDSADRQQVGTLLDSRSSRGFENNPSVESPAPLIIVDCY